MYGWDNFRNIMLFFILFSYPPSTFQSLKLECSHASNDHLPVGYPMPLSPALCPLCGFVSTWTYFIVFLSNVLISFPSLLRNPNQCFLCSENLLNKYLIEQLLYTYPCIGDPRMTKNGAYPQGVLGPLGATDLRRDSWYAMVRAQSNLGMETS